MNHEVSVNEIQQDIHFIRGQRVILDHTLAEFYGMENGIFKRAVRRNITRFPSDFMFELTQDEAELLIPQIGVSKLAIKNGRGGNRFFPFAFTEAGVAMLSSLFNSERAVQITISLIRAFVQLRQIVEKNVRENQAVVDDILERLEFVEKKLEQVLTNQSEPRPSLQPPKEATQPPRFERKFASDVETIQQVVGKYYDVSMQDLKAARRDRMIALARQIGMYLIRQKTGLGFKEIGAYFGGKDHSTVFHACSKVKTGIENDFEIRQAVEAIQTFLLNQSLEFMA